MSNMERRFTELRVECRLRSDEQESRTIGGYAAVFNNIDLGDDVILEGILAKDGDRKRVDEAILALHALRQRTSLLAALVQANGACDHTDRRHPEPYERCHMEDCTRVRDIAAGRRG